MGENQCGEARLYFCAEFDIEHKATYRLLLDDMDSGRREIVPADWSFHEGCDAPGGLYITYRCLELIEWEQVQEVKEKIARIDGVMSTMLSKPKQESEREKAKAAHSLVP